MKRAAQEAIRDAQADRETMGQVQARVDTTGARDRAAVSGAHALVDGPVGARWSELNKDPNFIAWTKGNDVYSGLHRQELTPEGVVRRR